MKPSIGTLYPSVSYWQWYFCIVHRIFTIYSVRYIDKHNMLCYFIGVMFFVRLSGNADIGLVNPKGFSRSTRSYVCTCSNLCRTRGHSLPLCWLLHFFSNLLTKGSSGYEWRWIGYFYTYHHMCWGMDRGKGELYPFSENERMKPVCRRVMYSL